MALIIACTIGLPFLDLGMGIYFATLDSTIACQMVTLISMLSRDWLQPTAVSMHY